MKVTGFTIVKNAVKYGYPVKEAILSILPICDEFIISVGKSEDNTLAYLQELKDPKIKIIETVWDEQLVDGGKILAVETNKVFQKIDPQTDWCFYIQADEVVHEDYLETIRNDMERYLDQKQVEGLLFKYLHFYHSYAYTCASHKFYKCEIRIIRNDKSIYSYRDAQGFRIGNNRKLKVKLIDAYIYHYGWVRPPEKMLKKQENFLKYYREIKPNLALTKDNIYRNSHKGKYLIPFNYSHPALMKSQVSKMDWHFDIKEYRKDYSLKDKLKRILKKYTPINPDYTNYKLI